MTFEYRVAAKIKKKAESLLRLVFRYVKSSYSAQQHPAPSAKIKVKIRFAGDDHLLFLLVIHILPSTLCQHCFMEERMHSVSPRGESQVHVQLGGRQPESHPLFGGTGILPVIKRQAGCLSHQGSCLSHHFCPKCLSELAKQNA
jgi:hypothetical protein